ncbi:MAG: hypothetical protein B7X71_10590 [Polynucleobacter sp. 39-46-10]|jgi:hypothetical protein|nr:MAG: hypothetical protein B7X71_10590 [Polynucleobacter sp. 39-46-10]
MSNNAHVKLWLQKQQNQTAIMRAQAAIQSLGRALPCRVVSVAGSIVTVKFELDTTPWVLPEITIPKAESPWIRMPTQVGDAGITVPADALLGGIAGLGGGVPKITSKPANLTALVFMPVSTSGSPPSDQNAAIAQGPNGFIGQTTTGTPSSVKSDTSGTTMTFGSNTAKLDSTGFHVTIGSYTVSITSAGMSINGISFDTHVHGGVTAGTSDTTGPI